MGGEPGEIVKALRALPSAVVGAAIVSIGGVVASIVDVPRIAVRSVLALVRTPYIGKNLKVMTGILLPVAAIASMVLCPVVGLLVGLGVGFSAGAEEGFSHAVKEAAHTVARYRIEEAGRVIHWLKEQETGNLPEGKIPFDIPVSGALKGLGGGAVNGVLVGVVGAALVAVYWLPAAVRGAFELCTNDRVSVPFMIALMPVWIVAFALVTALVPVAGAVYGMGVGARDSYRRGIAQSLRNSRTSIVRANGMLAELIFR